MGKIEKLKINGYDSKGTVIEKLHDKIQEIIDHLNQEKEEEGEEQPEVEEIMDCITRHCKYYGQPAEGFLYNILLSYSQKREQAGREKGIQEAIIIAKKQSTMLETVQTLQALLK